MDFLSLDALSTELLLKIFKYLNVFDLCRLRLTCRRINNVINAWAHEFVKSEDLLATNQVHSTISTRFDLIKYFRIYLKLTKGTWL